MDVTLETRRLVLRQPRPDDAARITRFINNFAVSGKLSRVPYPYKLSDAEWWLGNWSADKPPGETGFVVELPGEGFIGHCGFHPDIQGIVLGYWLGEPFWNRGFMCEAAAAVIDWYFGVAQVDHVGCGAFAFNKASLVVQKKLGFVEVGTSRRHCLARQEDLRHIDTRLTRARWDERRHGASARETT
jgi:RimJ/RimL family protein N-acetyltransferase